MESEPREALGSCREPHRDKGLGKVSLSESELLCPVRYGGNSVAVGVQWVLTKGDLLNMGLGQPGLG